MVAEINKPRLATNTILFLLPLWCHCSLENIVCTSMWKWLFRQPLTHLSLLLPLKKRENNRWP